MPDPNAAGWVIGVCMNLAGSICINGGTNLMKHGHTVRNLEVQRLEEDRKFYDKNPDPTAPMPKDPSQVGKPRIWYFGTAAFVCGSILNFVSFSFAAQSLIAALGSAQFISNVFFGWYILGEKVTPHTVLATAVIVGGNALVVTFSSHRSVIYTADMLMGFYDADYCVYGGCMLAIVAALRWFYLKLDARVKAGEVVKHSRILLPVSYAIMSAILGTQSVVQAKCLSVLLRASIKGDNQLKNWYTYFVLILWLGATSFWLKRMNAALSMFDGLFIIPVLQVFWTFFSILSGGIYFEEFQSFSWGQLIGFMCGVCVVFLGVYMLTPKGVDPAELPVGDSESDTRRLQLTSTSFHGPLAAPASSPGSPQLACDRARGFSYSHDDKASTRMLTVWSITTDEHVRAVVDAEPIRKATDEVLDRVVEGSKRVIRSASFQPMVGKSWGDDNNDKKKKNQQPLDSVLEGGSLELGSSFGGERDSLPGKQDRW